MIYKVSEVKRKRRERFTLAGDVSSFVPEEEETEEEEDEEVEEQKLGIAKSIWDETIAAPKLQPIQLPQLEFDDEDDEAKEDRFASISDIEEEEEEERVETVDVSSKLTDADVSFTTLVLEDEFRLPEFTYEDSNGRADSRFYHDLWWTKAAGLESLVLQHPRFIPDKGDVQFETMVRIAEVAPEFIMKNDPGNLLIGMRNKVNRNMMEMIELAEGSYKRVERKIAEPKSVGKRPIDANSIKLLTMSSLVGRDVFTTLQNYHQPEVVRAYDRTFLQSLDKELSQLRHDVDDVLTKDNAVERLFSYIDEMVLLDFVDQLVLDPTFIPESENPDLSFKNRWKRHWKRILRLQERGREERQLIDLDALEDGVWKDIQGKLVASNGVISQELWEDIVLTAATTGSIPWSGKFWPAEHTELLLVYLEMILAILQLYTDTIDGIIRAVDDDISFGFVDEDKRELETQRRVSARLRPFVIALRLEEYAVPKAELLEEIVLNAFYGVERSSSGSITQITQESDDGTESLRLLPRYQPELLKVIEKATSAGVSGFDTNNYTSGSYNYVNKIKISKLQADVLGSSAIDQKVLSFRNQLIEALERYREVTKRTPFLENQSIPSFVGHDMNFILCKVATYIHTAKTVDIIGVLRAAVNALPQLQTESRRSKRVSEFLLYYALSLKLFLFEDGYLEVPKRDPKKVTKRRTQRNDLSEFVELEAEGEGEDDGEEERGISLKERRSKMEKRILRVASELYIPNNILSVFDRSTNDDKDKIVSEGSVLKWKQYIRGVNKIKKLATQELSKYRDLWLNVEGNARKIKENSWVVTDGDTKVKLEDEQIVDSIPVVRDITKGAELTLSALYNTFYSAVSVRELMHRGRKALPDAPNELHLPSPLVVSNHSSTDIKERSLKVVQQFLISGYLLPSNADSLAAGLTIIQLMRVLNSNSDVLIDSRQMIFMVTKVADPDFIPVHELKEEDRGNIACGLLSMCMDGNADGFRDLLYYASIQDIRVAGVLTLQIDYWLPAEDSKSLIDDIKTDIVSELVIHLLKDEEAIERYNDSIDATNKSIREKTSDPLILKGVNAFGVSDFLVESDYGNLALNNLLQLETDIPAVIYTPWLSIQQALRIYLQSLEEDQRSIAALCTFINASVGQSLAINYIRTDCGREVVIDVQKDDILNRKTFQLLEKHSLFYDGENYDSRLEAIVAYFAMTATTLFTLNGLKDILAQLTANQRQLWTKVADAALDKIEAFPDKDHGVILEEILTELNRTEQKSYTTILEIMSQSVFRDLKMESDDKLHQSRAVKGRPYTGYIFVHDKTSADGVVSTVRTPVYPKYHRMLKRMLTSVKESIKQKKHWLDVWKFQYRTRVLVQMKQKDGIWKPFAEIVDSALTLEDVMGRSVFENMKNLLPEPPIRPGRKSTEFYGFGRGSSDKTVIEDRDIMLLISHIMEIPRQYAGLAMLLFVMPDARTASAYDMTHFIEAIQTMKEISVLSHIASRGVSDYLNTHTAQEVTDDVVLYVQRVHKMFEDAKSDLLAGKIMTKDVKKVALVFSVSVDDVNLMDDIDTGIEGVHQLEGFIAALRYPFTNPGQFMINHMISEVTTGKQHVVSTTTEGVYTAEFLGKKSSMTIPGPMKKVKLPIATTEKTEESIVATTEKEEPRRKKKRRVVTIDDEEEVVEISPALRELMNTLAQVDEEGLFQGEMDVTL